TLRAPEARERASRAKFALRHADTVIAVSSDLAQDIAKFGRSAEVVRFTVNPDKFLLRPRDASAPVILFVGKVTRAKGVDLLLDAFARIQRRDAKLVMIGTRFSDIDVEEEAKRLGIADRVELRGELPENSPALAEAYALSTCLVLPSRSE